MTIITSIKRNYLILTAIAFVFGFALFGCKKDNPETLTPKITDDNVEVTAISATFTWTVEWIGNRISVVELSEHEDMSDSQFYGSEEELNKSVFTVSVKDLKPGTKYYYRYWVWNHNYLNNKFVMETKQFTTSTDIPKVKTVEITDVTRTTATVIGEVTDDCGAEVTERGICWSTNHNPSTNGSHLNSGTGTGTFSIEISNLEVGEAYFVRAYAININGTAYGEELDFVTGDAVKPTVTTAEVTNIDWRTATGGGEVTDDGDATVTERGICWSTSHDPEVSGDHASNGTGTGSYTVNITGLTAGTTYYVRAYAKNIAGLNYGNEVSFDAKAPELPVVTTNTVTDISWTTAIGGGNVTSDGGTEVTERGICWGTSHNPDLNNGFSHLAASSASTGSFTCSLTGLNPNTKYYVRAYATNSKGTSYGDEKDFTTQALQKPTVTTSQVTDVTQTTATGGGNVTSDGGDPVTERGIYFGTSPNPAATGTKLVASSAGTGSFTCTMTGLVEGTTYYVCAYATNGQGTSYGSEKNFYYGSVPVGAIKGVFSVGSDKKVYFSRGNLQYRASDGRWRFAEHQYDYIGEGNSNISSTYSNYIDLFGWGTSGWNSGAVCYQPWSTSTAPSDYYPGGSYTNNLTGNYANADWGMYNSIYNGGNQASQWHTLTRDEWVYVFRGRSGASSKYGHGKVNGVCGMILLPDSWTFPSGLNFTAGDSSWANSYTADQWVQMESNGAVFLPAAGFRYGTSVSEVGSFGHYWSVSYYDSGRAYCVDFSGGNFYPLNFLGRGRGQSVRLVAPAE
ncbi:MAG: hypothetical protein K6A94_13185 [Bacteroidales bacterium]|nr:hypothetical protein [Bacteroidales bacterium]